MSENETMQFYTGKDYPHLCNGCKAMVDQCVDLVQMGADTDDNEAPIMFAYDHALMCGGRECECDCSIGHPLLDNHDDILCPVHGGTEAEQQAFMEQECNENGHWFPYMRDGYCLVCRKAYGQTEQIKVGSEV